MNDWFTLHTFIAFVLGVMLSAMVKGNVGKVRAKVGA